jgi:hypothetical protein
MSDNEDQEQEAVIVDEPEDPNFVPQIVDSNLLAESLLKMDFTTGKLVLTYISI